MPDYELLELVLFRAIPHQTLKPLARRLFENFSDFNHLLSASVHQLSATQGIGDAVICGLKNVETATHRFAHSRVTQRPVVSGWDALLNYCRSTMAHRETEQFQILYLDLKNVLIADKLQAKGAVYDMSVYPHEGVKRVLELNTAAFILVHNHLSVDPSPSEADITMTQKIQRAAKALSITVHDHLIIGKSAELRIPADKLL